MLLNPLLKWALGGTLFLSLMLGGALFMERRHSAKLQTQLIACSDGRKADRQSYELAQSKAKADNLEQVRKVETQQKAINDETVSNLNARLELLRRELRKGTSAPQGAAGSAGPSQAPDRPATPSEAGLCLAPSELLRAAENEERHDQLITLLERLIAEQK